MANLLLELGTEELPPLRLTLMSKEFGDNFTKLLISNNLSYDSVETFCSPRRLAILVHNLSEKQEDTTQMRRGPAKKVAFDDSGNPSKALLGFAKSCGLNVDDLEEIVTDKGVWLGANIKSIGKNTIDLIPDFLAESLQKLPIAKKMRWGNSDFEFVRPVHWIVALFGSQIVPIKLFGVSSSNESRGHRFHSPDKFTINSAEEYQASLMEHDVVANFEDRKQMISEQVFKAAQDLGGVVKINPNLLDEVTNLVEYPVALSGCFDDKFLQIPVEAIVAFMEGHQKFFAIFNENGELLPKFIAISNIRSTNPESVISGNERVIRPRLSDALFFWEQDKKHDLDEQINLLNNVVHQKQLGSVYDKVQRLVKISIYLAEKINSNVKDVGRAALLAKADLLSNMVGEFPKLQGIMGKYYAINSGEVEEVAQAIEDHYLPRYAGDKLPRTDIGSIVAMADKIDSLVGTFGIGEKPTGDKDPFSLRRSALGLIRILVEKNLPINLSELIDFSTKLFEDKITSNKDVLPFIMDRFEIMQYSQGISHEIFNSVQLKTTFSDFINRQQALISFEKTEVAEGLVQANKRIVNLLKKVEVSTDLVVNPDLFIEEAEGALYSSAKEIQKEVNVLVSNEDYFQALEVLSRLSPYIEKFFDTIMVMSDDKTIKYNRLSILFMLRNMFLQVADISKMGK